jgi:hypothetical protein
LIPQASIVSVNSPTRLYFEPIKFLNFDFKEDSDPDLAFHSNADPDPASPLPELEDGNDDVDEAVPCRLV